MNCRIESPKNGAPSLLGEQLVEIYNIKDVEYLKEKFSVYTTPEFKERFGDWTQESGEAFKDRVNKIGEPLILEDDFGNFYVLDKDYNKLPINNRRFNGLEQLGITELTNFKNEVTSQIAAYIFNKHITTEDFSDITEVRFKLSDEISNFFKDSIELLPEEDRVEAAEHYSFLDEYNSDWQLEIEDFFKNKSLEYTDLDDLDENTQKNNEENGLGVDLKSSVEKNSKDNASAKIKLLLSFLPEVDRDGTLVYGDYIFAPKLLSFNKVWYDLEKELKDIPKVLQGDKVVDPLGVMKTKIKQLSIRKPYLKSLLNKLDVLDVSTQTQFVSAFADNTIYDFDTVEVDGKQSRRKYTRLNAAETSNKANKILNDWGLNFQKIFLKQVNSKDSLDISKFNATVSTELDILKKEFETIRKLFQRNMQLPESRRLDMSEAITQNLTSFKDVLNKFGIDTSLEAVDYFLSDMGELSVFTEQSYLKNMREFINGFDFLVSAIAKKPRKVIQDGVLINPFMEEGSLKQTVISNLAKANSFFNQEISENTLMAADKILWKYALSSHANDKINIWKEDLLDLEKIAENTNSLFAKLLISNPKALEALKIKMTSTLQQKGKAGEGTDNKSTSEVDALNRDIFEVLGHRAYGGTPTYQTPTPADKSTALKLSINHFLESGAREIDGEFKLNTKILNIFVNYMEDMYVEAIKAKNDIKAVTDKEGNIDTSNLIQFYHANSNGYVLEVRDLDNNVLHETNNSNLARIFVEENKGTIVFAGNAFKNSLAPSLSFDVINRAHPDIPRGTFYKTTGEPITTINKFTDTQRQIMSNKVRDMIQVAIRDTINDATQADILKEDGNNNNIDFLLWDKYKGNTISLFGDYVVNSMIAQIEYSKLFTGSIAMHKNVSDYFKRVPGTYISGKGLRLGIEKNDHKFKISVLNDVIVDTEYSKEMPGVAEYYKGINQADAQAYITPKRWKFLKDRLGQWSPKHDVIYKKLINNQSLNSKEVKLISAQPLKGVYRSLINGRPVYLKYSQAVLLPGLAKGSPLDRLGKQMEKQGVDEAIMNSGIKVGANIVNNVTNDILEGNNFQLDTIDLDNRFWKLQQDLPTKMFKDTLLGSQLQKNIFNNIKFDKTYDDLEGRELYKELHNVISALSDLGRAEIISQLSIGSDFVIKDWSNFTKAIVDMLKEQGSDNNTIKAVEKEMSPYVLPSARIKILNTVFSMINKKTVKIKTNGASLIQMSNFGLDSTTAEEKGVYWLKDPATLAEPRMIKGIDGRRKVLPGQVFIPASFMSKYIPDWRNFNKYQLFGGKDPETGLEHKAMVDPRALELIGYRIPNQGTSSNDSLQVVGILPEGYGDTVVTYTGITTKTGSDFDIDKMFIMAPHLNPIFKANPITFLKKSGLTRKRAKSLLTKLGYYSYDTTNNIKNDPIEELYSYIRNNEAGVTNPELKAYITALDEWIASQPDVRLEYVEFDKEAGYLGNGKKALQNRVLELYQKVLKSEHTYKSLMTPLDYPFMKKDIIDLHDLEGKNLGDLEMVSPFYQVKLKYQFLAGSFGIGQVANQLVDHMRGQTANMSLPYSFGWGNFIKTKKGSIQLFDVNEKGENLSESLPGIEPERIDQSISAILNAFVDIAKDAYITSGNWNTLTTNMGLMLLRAGVHPFKVNAFLGQPIIKRVAKETFAREGKLRLIDKPSGTIIEELRSEYINDLVHSYIKDQYPDATADEVFAGKYTKEKEIYEEIINPLLSEDYKKVKIDGITINNRIQYRSIGELRKNIKDLDYQKTRMHIVEQLLALKEYEGLNNISKTFRLGVSSSKFGESGAGVNPTQLMISKNNIGSVLESKLSGFSNKFVDPNIGVTSLGTYFNNTIGLVSDLVEANPKLFLTNTEFFRKLFNEIASESHSQKEFLNDENIGKMLDESMYSALLSNFSALSMPQDLNKRRAEYNELFSNLYDEVESLKKRSDNFLIKELELKKDGKFKFIGINGTRNKPNEYSNKVTEAWLDLSVENKALSDKLVKYAYYQSGFRNNINAIFKYIPHEYFIENNLDSYIDYLSKENNVLNSERIKDQIYRHNWENSKLVPIIAKGDIAGTKRNKKTREYYLILNSDTTKNTGFNNFKQKTYPPFVTKFTGKNKVDPITGEITEVEPQQLLYKLTGYQEIDKGQFEAIYTKTHKLGYKSNKGQFHEMDLSNDITESIYKDNNVSPEHKQDIDNLLEMIGEKRNLILEGEYESDIFQREYKKMPNVTSFGNIIEADESILKEEKDDNPLDCKD